MKNSLEKKAEKDGLTLYNEVKKILVKNTPASDIPKGVAKGKIVRRKMTDEQIELRRERQRRYRERVRKERRKKARVLKRKERMR